MALWNGNLAALSLTFDDGLKCQLDHAVPVMTKRGVPGTFFLIEESQKAGYGPLNVDAWKQVLADGHEIGSHSTNHLKAASLGVDAVKHETEHSKKFLESTFSTTVNSFCYPYTDAPYLLQDAVRAAGYKQARGGRTARLDKFVCPGQGLNYLNTPCYHINAGAVQDVPGLLAAALWKKAWVTFMLHGVGPDGTQWDNVWTADFDLLLDHICRAREQGLWVTTYGNAAESLRSSNG